MEIYHQEGANLNDPDQNVEFISGENNNYYQSGFSYPEFYITIRNPGSNFDNNSQIRITNNPYAHCFKEATLGTTGGREIGKVTFSGQDSTIM